MTTAEALLSAPTFWFNSRNVFITSCTTTASPPVKLLLSSRGMVKVVSIATLSGVGVLVGAAEGDGDGISLGLLDGEKLGMNVGDKEGSADGGVEGELVGMLEGRNDGCTDGARDCVGGELGLTDGLAFHRHRHLQRRPQVHR
mmetsp:Transcript_35062/g.76008  ORF Transcript_35062/g.76008 Transcript_35062/m.76008 type:complete len:143 (+) Transcript_35062:1362-1790(+)